MKRSALVVALLVVAAAALAGVTRLRRDRGPSLPTSVVTKGTFVDYLQLRGEIRPIHSVIRSQDESVDASSAIMISRSVSVCPTTLRTARERVAAAL